MIGDEQIPDIRVVLGLLERRGPLSWYELERLTPLHPDCVGPISVRTVLAILADEGLVTSEVKPPLDSWRISDSGCEKAASLRRSRLENPATATVELTPRKFARLPARRFAGRVFFDETMEFLPLGMTFLSGLDDYGKGLAFVSFLMPNCPANLLKAGRVLRWREGSEVIGEAKILLAPSFSEPQVPLTIVDRWDQSDATPRRRAA